MATIYCCVGMEHLHITTDSIMSMIDPAVTEKLANVIHSYDSGEQVGGRIMTCSVKLAVTVYDNNLGFIRNSYSWFIH